MREQDYIVGLVESGDTGEEMYPLLVRPGPRALAAQRLTCTLEYPGTPTIPPAVPLSIPIPSPYPCCTVFEYPVAHAAV